MENERVLFFNTVGANNNLPDFIARLNDYGVQLIDVATIDEAINAANLLFDTSPLTWNSFIGSLTFDNSIQNWTNSPDTRAYLQSLVDGNNDPSQRTSGNFWDSIGKAIGVISGGTSSTTVTTGSAKPSIAPIVIAILSILIISGVVIFLVFKRK